MISARGFASYRLVTTSDHRLVRYDYLMYCHQTPMTQLSWQVFAYRQKICNVGHIKNKKNYLRITFAFVVYLFRIIPNIPATELTSRYRVLARCFAQGIVCRTETSNQTDIKLRNPDVHANQEFLTPEYDQMNLIENSSK